MTQAKQRPPQPEAEETPPHKHEQGQEQGQQEAAPAVEPQVDFKDRYVRAMAEMENLRKRAERDVEDARRFAVTNFARSLLDVADNLERALAFNTKEADHPAHIQSLCEGVEMVQNQLQRVFGQFKIEKTAPDAGEKFNPEQHQAMFEVPTDEHPAGAIVQVMQPGYVIAGRLLRPALVGTAKPLSKTE